MNLAPARASANSNQPPTTNQPRAEILMQIMLVQLPQSERPAAENIWNHLKEDMLDADTMTRIRRNGMRVGVGRLEFWEPIQAALSAIDGTRSNPWEPLRIPPAYVLGLELDTVPREQTIFCVQDDGILSGGTFADSRNVLQMMCLLDPRDKNRVHLNLVPEVRQELELSAAAGAIHVRQLTWSCPEDGSAERLIEEGFILPTEQIFQAPGGATTKKAIFKFYYHYAYPLGKAIEQPKLVPDFIEDKNGHILPFVKFEGGSLRLDDAALNFLNTL